MFLMLSHWIRFSAFSWYLSHSALKTQWKLCEVGGLNWAPILPSYLAVILRAGTEIILVSRTFLLSYLFNKYFIVLTMPRARNPGINHFTTHWYLNRGVYSDNTVASYYSCSSYYSNLLRIYSFTILILRKL